MRKALSTTIAALVVGAFCIVAMASGPGDANKGKVTFNNDVAPIEKWFYQVNRPVDRRSGFDQKNYLPWQLKRFNKLFRRVRAEDLLTAVARNKRVKHRLLAFVDSNRIAVSFDVESEVLAHYPKTNQSNGVFSHIIPISNRGFPLKKFKL